MHQWIRTNNNDKREPLGVYIYLVVSIYIYNLITERDNTTNPIELYKEEN